MAGSFRILQNVARAALWLTLCALAATTPVRAEQTGAISGVVTTHDGKPAAAIVTIVDDIERRRSIKVEADGRFRIAGLASGVYLIEARTDHDEAAVISVALRAGQQRRLDLRLSAAGAAPQTRVVVTARPRPVGADDLVNPVSVLSGTDLLRRKATSLGATLNHLPNVGSTGFGEGANRPIIRGLGGPRVRILQSGIGTFDVSDTSDDHAVTIDPFFAERIEIIRGPATLMYGNSAIGGVVNVLHDRIARAPLERPLLGIIEGGYETGAQRPSIRTKLRGGVGPLVFHFDGVRSDANSYLIPGEPGKQFNSHVKSGSGAAGASLVGEDGYFGFSLSGFRKKYGVPSSERVVTLDARQNRLDIEGALRHSFWIFEGAKLRWGWIDYKHQEKTPEEVKITFRNEGYEGRIVLPHRKIGPFRGALGFQMLHRKFAAAGEEESFLQPTRTTSFAVFLFEEIKQDAFTHQFGIRIENVTVRPSEEGFRTKRRFAFSGAVGSQWAFAPGYAAGVNLSVTQRVPAAQELFANGPHEADETFQLGDAALGKETAIGGELSVRKTTGRFTGRVNLFANYILDFVYLRQRGGQTVNVEDEEFALVNYVQDNALFAGVEAQAALLIYQRGPHRIGVDASLGFTHATIVDKQEFVSRIPPLKIGGGAFYKHANWDGRVELIHHFGQMGTAPGEYRTKGFTLLNASLAHRFDTEHGSFELVLSGKNLLNQRARNAASFLKESVLMPGRTFQVLARMRF